MAEWAERHRAARRAGRERTSLRIAAPLDEPGRPPSAADLPLVSAWRTFLEFELNGPFKLPPADEVARATLALEQALLPLRHHAEIYHLAALHFAKLGQLEVARSYWARGAHVLPSCPLLPLAEAEFEERAGNLESAADAYERLARAATGPLAWVHALRFTRRTKGVAAARAFFARARREPTSGWQIYTAAATLEASAVPDRAGPEAEAATQIAINIFEKGLLAHGADLAYIKTYADFLYSKAMADELRALYERTLARVDGDDDALALAGPASEARPSEAQLCAVWDAYIDLERELGSMEAVCALEQRRAARHPKTPDPLSAHALTARLSYKGLLPCSPDEATLLGVGQGQLLAPSFGESSAAAAAGGVVAAIGPARPTAGAAAGGGGAAGRAAEGGFADGDGGGGGGGERERRGRADGRAGRTGGGRTGAGGADGEGADVAGRATAAEQEPLGEVEAMLLARQLNAPEQVSAPAASAHALSLCQPVPAPAIVPLSARMRCRLCQPSPACVLMAPSTQLTRGPFAAVHRRRSFPSPRR